MYSVSNKLIPTYMYLMGIIKASSKHRKLHGKSPSTSVASVASVAGHYNVHQFGD